MSPIYAPKKIILLITLVSCVFIVHAQRWEKEIPARLTLSWPHHSTVDQTMDLGYILGLVTIDTVTFYKNYGLIVKVDCNGNVQWKRIYKYFDKTSCIKQLKTEGML